MNSFGNSSSTGSNLKLSEQLEPHSTILTETKNTNVQATFLGDRSLKKMSSRIFRGKSNTEYFSYQHAVSPGQEQTTGLYLLLARALSAPGSRRGKKKPTLSPQRCKVAVCWGGRLRSNMSQLTWLCCMNVRRNQWNKMEVIRLWVSQIQEILW